MNEKELRMIVQKKMRLPTLNTLKFNGLFSKSRRTSDSSARPTGPAQRLSTWARRTACAPSFRRLLSIRRGSLSSPGSTRSEEHTSELQSRLHLVCRLLLEKKKNR